MKFILDKDKIEVKDKEKLNSGSINYYEADVEYDESWDGLTIKAVIVASEEKTGKSISLIDDKIYLDNDLDGTYNIGFVGYTIENNKKVYQISTRLLAITFKKGAGQITTQEGTLPTPTQWEIYVAQLQEIVDDITGLSTTLTAQVEAVEERLANGDFDGADGITPTIGLNGNWFLGETDTGKPSRGENGTNGTNGINGQDGADGFSPVANVTQISNGAKISITDKTGTTTVNVLNGTDGRDGTNRYKSDKMVLTVQMDLAQ